MASVMVAAVEYMLEAPGPLMTVRLRLVMRLLVVMVVCIKRIDPRPAAAAGAAAAAAAVM